jgi:hypothetical protein
VNIISRFLSFKDLVANCHSYIYFYINRADIQYLYILLVEYHSFFQVAFQFNITLFIYSVYVHNLEGQ